jgi:hypothetical protein
MSMCRNRVSGGWAACSAGVLAALILPALLLISCGGGVVEALVVPFITFEFQGVSTDAAGAQQIVHLSLFSSDNDAGKTSGSLTANLHDDNQNFFAITGSYRGNDFSLSAPGATAPLAPNLTGKFIEVDTIQLTPTSGGLPPLILVRTDQSFVPQLHDSRWSGTDAATGLVWKVHFSTVPDGDAGPVEFLTADETAGGTSGTVKGYAVMRRIEIDVTRGAQTFHRSGRMGPAGPTPPISPPTLTPAQTMTFSDGSTLTRD